MLARDKGFAFRMFLFFKIFPIATLVTLAPPQTNPSWQQKSTVNYLELLFLTVLKCGRAFAQIPLHMVVNWLLAAITEQNYTNGSSIVGTSRNNYQLFYRRFSTH